MSFVASDQGVGASVGGAEQKFSRSILIVATDLYEKMGGGQTTYRAIIENSPETLFYYFFDTEAPSARRPSNTRPIPQGDFYYANVGDLPAELGHFYRIYLQCWQWARSFVEAYPGCDLDVVDCPDYETWGLFIRGALNSHRVKVGVVSLALHGALSSALLDDWGPRISSRGLAELRLRERLQYRAADSRYALSAQYAEDLSRQSGGYSSNAIDPLLVVGPMQPTLGVGVGDGKPDIAFIGRRERRKGPDLFVDALWSLDRGSYGRSLIVGHESRGHSGVGSHELLEAMAHRRGLDVEFVDAISRPELDEMFRQPTIVALPSRYDQFNLVCLEALRLGAPAFVSRTAGASRWIETHLPGATDLVFDISGGRALAAKLRDALADYKGLRERISEAISNADLKPNFESLSEMYRPAELGCHSAHEAIRDVQVRLDNFNRPREIGKLVLKRQQAHLPAWKRVIIESPLGPLAHAYHRRRMALALGEEGASLDAGNRGTIRHADPMAAISDRSQRSLEQLQVAIDLEGTRKRLLTIGERTREEIGEKLRAISEETKSKLAGRTGLFRDMARLERKRGGDIVAATYSMRLLRWMGKDSFGDLDFTVRTLRDHGFTSEAAVTEAMISDPEKAEERIRAYLQRQFQTQMDKAPGLFSIEDDRRSSPSPRVSVIVSLYNAESKLKLFLDQLSGQSLLKAGQMEIILIDSGSPTNERQAFEALMAENPLPVLYARTAERETIQAAWNRGIKLARAPYLSFLGVDEGVHPDGYAILAKMLDDQPGIDWVMADSVVTEVDRKGGFVTDVMTYDRHGYTQGLVYLETCYLSWVGGLYRRSIHERFGYYDETFRGAGDTEFKSRILPHIKSGHIAEPLGLFLNYPEERTTQHPRAEIEDQRAWYLFRTTAGAAYVWDGKPIEAVEDFFRQCLRYRKSFCGHVSTDLDMAHALARYMVQRGENPEFASAALRSSSLLIQLIRSIEVFDFRLSPSERSEIVLMALVSAKRQEFIDAESFKMSDAPRYEIFNDNRFEQHWYSWSS